MGMTLRTSAEQTEAAAAVYAVPRFRDKLPRLLDVV